MFTARTVAITTGVIIALASPSRSESLNDKLDVLNSNMQAGLSLCKIQAVLAEFRRPENTDLDNCIQTQRDKIANLLSVIIPLTKGRPKALHAMKEFHSTWEYRITSMGIDMEGDAPETMREQFRTLSKELGSHCIKDW